jgi:hypothetical protein
VALVRVMRRSERPNFKGIAMRFILKMFFPTAALVLSLLPAAYTAELKKVGAGSVVNSEGARLVSGEGLGMDKLLGTKWIELARTDVPSERGFSNVTMEFVAVPEGGTVMFAQGWDNGAGVWRRIGAVSEKSAQHPWWRFLGKPSKVPVEPLRCFRGADADGWIAILGDDGVRVLSKSRGMSFGAWERCCAALRAAGQSVGGLIYFF